MASTPFKISRRTVGWTGDGEQPRTLPQLRVLQALGAILNKRNWWAKWTTMPEVRAKWLAEIEDGLVKAMVSHIWSLWPNRELLVLDYEGRHHWDDGGFDGTDRLLRAARIADPTKKAAEIKRLLANVMYPPSLGTDSISNRTFSEGCTYESDGDEEMHEDDGPATRLRRRKPAVMPKVSRAGEEDDHDSTWMSFETEFDLHFSYHQTRKNSFGQVAWYIAMSLVREQLHALPLEDWTAETILELTSTIWLPENQDVVTGACDLIRAVLRDGPVTIPSLRTHLPREKRPKVLKLLRYHFAKVQFTLDSSAEAITGVLELAIRKLKLQDDSRPQDQPVYLPGPAPQTWLSDSCIPTELKQKFVAEIAVLENVSDDQKDWHPNSNEQVLDLVHPSLFCAVRQAGFNHGLLTYLVAENATETEKLDEYPSAAAHMKAIMFAPTPRHPNVPSKGLFPRPLKSKFQWLPSEFDVSDTGDAAVIRTYINNLHPEDHSALYDSIGAIFARFVPLFDHVLSSLDDSLRRCMPKHRQKFSPFSEATIQYQSSSTPGNGAKQFVASCLREETDDAKPSPLLCSLTPPTLFEVDKPRFSLKGKRCQVIVKIAEIVLTPEKPEYAGGSWHVEGTGNERIIATGLYYFGCENITESRLSFRTIVSKMPEEQCDNLAVPMTYGMNDGQVSAQTLGSVTAMEDRCVVFPNLLHHKVEPFRLKDPTKPGVRKILAFFLVDPTGDPVISTAVVPPQQQAWADRMQEPAFKKLRVPDVVVDRIKGFDRERMSLAQAQAYRLELMAERASVPLDDRQEFTLSLCEH